MRKYKNEREFLEDYGEEDSFPLTPDGQAVDAPGRFVVIAEWQDDQGFATDNANRVVGDVNQLQTFYEEGVASAHEQHDVFVIHAIWDREESREREWKVTTTARLV